MREELRAILLLEPGLTAIVDPVRVFTRPLVRPGEDPDQLGTEPTPDAFDAFPPYWLRPSIVVGSRVVRMPDQRRTTPDTQTARWGLTLAYYVPPDSEDVLPSISWYVSVALGRANATIVLPGNRVGRAVVPHDISPTVPVPEFPGAGFVMLERISIPVVWTGAVR
ncbi:MAG: hypothetical protein ACR2M1_10525 [Gemmatimonadaceae bacterium]